MYTKNEKRTFIDAGFGTTPSFRVLPAFSYALRAYQKIFAYV